MKYIGIGLLLGIIGCFLSIYGLAEEEYILYNSFLFLVNFCFSIFWIKEIVNEKLRK